VEIDIQGAHLAIILSLASTHDLLNGLPDTVQAHRTLLKNMFRGTPVDEQMQAHGTSPEKDFPTRIINGGSNGVLREVFAAMIFPPPGFPEYVRTLVDLTRRIGQCRQIRQAKDERINDTNQCYFVCEFYEAWFMHVFIGNLLATGTFHSIVWQFDGFYIKPAPSAWIIEQATAQAHLCTGLHNLRMKVTPVEDLKTQAIFILQNTYGFQPERNAGQLQRNAMLRTLEQTTIRLARPKQLIGKAVADALPIPRKTAKRPVDSCHSIEQHFKRRKATRIDD
jgi:hypothetical protein